MTYTFDYKELIPEVDFKEAKLFRIRHTGWYQKAGDPKRWEAFAISCSNDENGRFWCEPIPFVSENTQYELEERLKEKKYEVLRTDTRILREKEKLSYSDFKELPRLKLGMWKF